MLACIDDNHVKKGTVYYDKTYFLALVSHLYDEQLLGKFHGELKPNSQGPKMCSIASSSRLCYLATKSVKKYQDVDEYEKTDVYNGICHPHYDAYSSKTNTFYEFKCHEMCDGVSHGGEKLSDKYSSLLNEYFDVPIDIKPADLRFSDLDIEFEDNPSIYSLNFNLKQFICHILGLLSIASKNNKLTLQYVWVVPSATENMSISDKEELKEYLERIEKQIRKIFDLFNNKKVNLAGNKITLNELIKIELDILPADEINDFILNNI